MNGVESFVSQHHSLLANLETHTALAELIDIVQMKSAGIKARCQRSEPSVIT